MSEPITSPSSTRILRASIWVAIGALIAAAVVCVVWVLIGDDNGIVGKAFLTILLLAGFAGVSIGEANLASRRPAWLALASMVAWVLTLLIGAFLIWMPSESSYGIGAERFFRFVLIALIIQGALLHARLLIPAHLRNPMTFTTVVTYVTIGLVVILAAMLVIALIGEEFTDFRPLYWRVVVALAILAAVGTALVPLVNALFAPKRPRPAVPGGYAAAPAYGLPGTPGAPAAYGAPVAPVASAWPTYADGWTPLPVLPDGSPDWNAYYTGHPSMASPAVPAAQEPAPAAPAALAAAPQVAPAPPVAPAPGYQGYPPAPPVPPLPPQQG